ncbi:YgfZ/GcvT domain-containing protein [Rodentibacter caecimuris]|uniref:Aminomethyltransferase folate-binding domain-containing protein n=1 Tax=Rodentibacter caecimuris TaxID=1796644 RepID=A0ABX3L036_9PAST|nr:hypothetical protein BKG89_00440 [Rodentibacter heylii]
MTQFIDLTDYQLIQVSGDDASTFLQGQLTCDVNLLAEGSSTLTAHCDPKGKMTSIFQLIRLEPQQFLILIRSALLPAALDALKKYAVFSKVIFQSIDWQIVGIIGEKCGRIQPDFSITLPDGRTILLNKHPALINFNGSLEEWEYANIQAGLPQLYPQTQCEFIPQAMNLQALGQAISFSKGCYIGQETVARAKYRGANKRAMFILYGKTDITPEIGSELEIRLGENKRKTGVVVNAVNIRDSLWLQAVMNSELSEIDEFYLPETDVGLKRYPLPYTL